MHDSTLRRGFRHDLQGLRAVAVLLVVVYHLYPNRLSGGFVGVDIFFVLSGYFITSHLLRDVAASGRLSLVAFWGRRIRRLLPASLLVLALSALATWLWVPRTAWDTTLEQIGASALYVQNWALADAAVDYSASGADATLVQHFWSLSVEEQFYLFWPLLVLGALLLARRTHLHPRAVLATTVGAVVVLSFAYSVALTGADPARAYFVTPTRVWELAVGALLALTLTEVTDGRRQRDGLTGGGAGGAVAAVVGWLGVAGIVWAGLFLDHGTPFPGWIAAVPVLGAVAVVATGGSRSPVAVSRLLGLRPLRTIGDISYAMYLWHWPMIVVLPYVTGVDLRTRDKVAIFVATIVVSWASTRWFEDPIRSGRGLRIQPWAPYAFGVAGMALVLVLSGSLRAALDHDVAASKGASSRIVQHTLEGRTTCIGPHALHPAKGEDCASVTGEGDPILAPDAVARQTKHLAFPGCMSMPEQAPVHTCDLGTEHRPERTIAVAGDSHVTHWFRALDALGKKRGWTIRTYTRAGCPFSDALSTRRSWPEHRYALCAAGNREVERRILADPDVDTVLVSADSSSYGWESPTGKRFADPAADGFRSVWKRLTRHGKQVVVIRDVPETKDDHSAPDCLAEHPGDPAACTIPRDQGVARDVEADATEHAPDGVRLVDLTDKFCDQQLCYPQIGNVIVYRDHGHLSDEYSTLLAPALGRAFDKVDRPLR